MCPPSILIACHIQRIEANRQMDKSAGTFRFWQTFVSGLRQIIVQSLCTFSGFTYIRVGRKSPQKILDIELLGFLDHSNSSISPNFLQKFNHSTEF